MRALEAVLGADCTQEYETNWRLLHRMRVMSTPQLERPESQITICAIQITIYLQEMVKHTIRSLYNQAMIANNSMPALVKSCCVAWAKSQSFAIYKWLLSRFYFCVQFMDWNLTLMWLESQKIRKVSNYVVRGVLWLTSQTDT